MYENDDYNIDGYNIVNLNKKQLMNYTFNEYYFK